MKRRITYWKQNGQIKRIYVITLSMKYSDVGNMNAPAANTGSKCLVSKICMWSHQQQIKACDFWGLHLGNTQYCAFYYLSTKTLKEQCTHDQKNKFHNTKQIKPTLGAFLICKWKNIKAHKHIKKNLQLHVRHRSNSHLHQNKNRVKWWDDAYWNN